MKWENSNLLEMSDIVSDHNLLWIPTGMSTTHLFGVSLLIIVVIILGSMKLFFGTISVPEIYKTFQYRKNLSEKYDKMFTTREGFLYHISWAKSRGEFKEAELMMKDLIEFDKV